MGKKQKSPARTPMPVLAFALPVALLLAALALNGVYPFGENTILIVDNYHQYTPFMVEFGDMLREGRSLFYSWNAGLGSNFLTRYAYYLSSPLSFLSALADGAAAVEFVLALVVVRAGLAGLFFFLYLRGKYGGAGIEALAFSALYALCGYFVAYYWNIMWFEAVALFPLVALGLERLADRGGGMLYCVSLALTILSNFFVAVMVCIFAVLYFFTYGLGRIPGALGEARPRRRFGACGSFALYSLLAGGLSAVVWLPACFGLLRSSAAEAGLPGGIEVYSGLLQILSGHLAMARPTVMTGPPNLYCGAVVLLLIPLYFLNGGIPLREKACHGLLLLFMLVSFNVNWLDFLWHGAHFPNSLPFRFSFLYVFLVLGLSYRAMISLDGRDIRRVPVAFTISLALLFLIEAELPESAERIPVYITLALLLGYGAALLPRKSRGPGAPVPPRPLRSIALTALICGEVLSNAASGFTEAGSFPRDNYVTHMEQVRPAVERVLGLEQGFERMEFTHPVTYNTPSVYGYKGITSYSSTSYSAVSRLMGRLGLSHSGTWYVYESSTPLINSMFSIKYLLSDGREYDNGLYPSADRVGDVRVYENPYYLPVGFMVRDSIFDWDLEEADPFLVQENFLRAALGEVDPVFRRLAPEEAGTVNLELLGGEDGTYRYRQPQAGAGRSAAYFDVAAPEDGPVYLYASSPKGKALLVSNGGKDKSYDMEYPFIVDAERVPAGQRVRVGISLSPGEADSFTLYACSPDLEAWQGAYQRLSAQGLRVAEYTDTRLTGSIDAREAGVLFTSIPYDKGWGVKVDGRPARAEAVGDGALLALRLEPGTHEIEFRYRPEGFLTGIGLSAASAALLAGLCLNPGRRGAKRSGNSGGDG